MAFHSQVISSKVKTKTQKVFRTNSCIWKIESGKNGWWDLLASRPTSPSLITDKVENYSNTQDLSRTVELMT